MNKEIQLRDINFYDLNDDEVTVIWEIGIGYVVYVNILNSEKKLRVIIPDSLNKAIQRQVSLQYKNNNK